MPSTALEQKMQSSILIKARKRLIFLNDANACINISNQALTRH